MSEEQRKRIYAQLEAKEGELIEQNLENSPESVREQLAFVQCEMMAISLPHAKESTCQ